MNILVVQDNRVEGEGMRCGEKRKRVMVKYFFLSLFHHHFVAFLKKKGGREFVNKVSLRKNGLKLVMRSMES